MNKKNIKSFAGLFPNVDIERVNASRPHRSACVMVTDSDSPESMLLGAVFAPDPETGLPSSDYAMYLSEKTNPNVRDYIKKYLFSEVPDASTMAKDLDTALDGVISTRVQSFADWREVQKDLVSVANMSKEEYKTFLAQKKVEDSKPQSE